MLICRPFLPSRPTIALACVLCASPLWAQNRSSLEIVTTPDSAQVTLDDASTPEGQATPYLNDKMLPGPHVILLRSRNSAHAPLVVKVDIQPGQKAMLSETFEYRTKTFGGEHLSIAPWKLEAGLGFEYLRGLGINVPSKTLPADAKSTLADSRRYPSDSVPSGMSYPLSLRIGLPHGLEGHFLVPLASRTASDGSSSSVGYADASMGFKWTWQKVNSAFDLTWNGGNASASRQGYGASSLEASLITNQKWNLFDVYGQLGYRKSLTSHASPHAVGDAVRLRARAGILVGNTLLPYVQADLDYRFPKTFRSPDSSSSSYLGTVTPGLVWHQSRQLAFEMGIPLGLLAGNGETRLGVNLSMTYGFQLGKSAPAAKRSQASAYGRSASSSVLPTGFVLFDSREVSNAHYKEFCEKTGREMPADPDFPGMKGYPTLPAYGDHPVVNISMEDARAFAKWAGKRLPTAAEWTREFSESNIPGSQVACDLDAPERVDSRSQGAGYSHYLGNVAEWVESDRGASNTAYIAGGFYSLPVERCLDKSRSIEIASPSASKYIGFRLVTDIK